METSIDEVRVTNDEAIRCAAGVHLCKELIEKRLAAVKKLEASLDELDRVDHFIAQIAPGLPEATRAALEEAIELTAQMIDVLVESSPVIGQYVEADAEAQS